MIRWGREGGRVVFVVVVIVMGLVILINDGEHDLCGIVRDVWIVVCVCVCVCVI